MNKLRYVEWGVTIFLSMMSEYPAKYPSINNKELEYIQGSIGYSDTLSGESQFI